MYYPCRFSRQPRKPTAAAAPIESATVGALRRRRKNRSRAIEQQEKQHAGANEYRVAELHQRDGTGRPPAMNELAGTRGPYELDAAQAHHAELYGNHAAAEMKAREDMTQVGTNTSYTHTAEQVMVPKLRTCYAKGDSSTLVNQTLYSASSLS